MFLEESEETLLLGFLLFIVAVALIVVMVLVVMVMAVALLTVLVVVFVLMLMVVIVAVAFAVLVVMVVMVVAEVAVLIDHVREAVVVMVAGAVRIVALLAVLVNVLVAVTVGIVAFSVGVMVVMALAVGVIALLAVLVNVLVAVAIRVIALLVVMVVLVLEALPVDEVVDSGVVDGMEHLVGQLVLVDVEDCAHEVEGDHVAAGKGTVVLHSVVHVDEVEGDSLAFLVDDGGFDVTEEASRFALHILTDGKERIGEPGFSVGIEVEELAAEACCAAPRLFHGILFVSAHLISS